MMKQDPEAFERQSILDDTPVAAPAKAKKVAAARAGVEGEEEDDEFQTVGNKGKTITISSEGIFKALAQVLEARGRKVCFDSLARVLPITIQAADQNE
jgi:translation initiation factor 3 subunit C